MTTTTSRTLRRATQASRKPGFGGGFAGIRAARAWHPRASAARRCSQPSRYAESGDDGVADRVRLRLEFLNRRLLIPTCLEAS
jgi:hypothetical protein